MRSPRLVVVGAFALSLGLGGCAGQSDLPGDVATSMQAQVMAVSTASAALDYPAALTRLAELEVSLDDAVARGTITAERAQAIRSAIELVRADLTVLNAPPPVEEEDNSGPGDGNGKPEKPEKPEKPKGKDEDED
jgi:hypothetical protein